MQQNARMAAACLLTEYLNVSWVHGARCGQWQGRALQHSSAGSAAQGSDGMGRAAGKGGRQAAYVGRTVPTKSSASWAAGGSTTPWWTVTSPSTP